MFSENFSVEKITIVNVIEEFERHLAQPNRVYPHEIIDSMLEHQEYVTPKLLQKLEQFIANPPRNANSGEWFEGVVALYVLAKFREQKAFPLVVQLCSFPHEKIEWLLGDIKTESMPSILASTFNGDYDTLASLVTNQYLDPYLRWSVLDTY